MNEHATTLIQELIHQGVKSFCIAPGSRNTPLTVAAFNHPLATTHIHYDERGLGFFALGMAKTKKTKVALIVTSGTAVGNLLPSIMEAYHDEIPLVILSADRPFELRASGANQSTNQVGIFSHFTLASWDIPLYDTSLTEDFIKKELAYYLHLSDNDRKGPCHLNVMIREPFFSNKFQENDFLECENNTKADQENDKNKECLSHDQIAYDKESLQDSIKHQNESTSNQNSSLLEKMTNPLKSFLQKTKKTIPESNYTRNERRDNSFPSYLSVQKFNNTKSSTYYPKTKKTLDESTFIELARDLSFYDNGIIYAGKEEYSKEILALSEILNWPIFADISSSLRTEENHDSIIPQYNLIDSSQLNTKIDAILHFGSLMTDKTCLLPTPSLYMHVSTLTKRVDPKSKVTHAINLTPETFAEGVLPYLKRKKSSKLHKEITQKQDVITSNLEHHFFHLTEGYIPFALAKIAIPSFSYFFGNSMSVRYADLFFYPKQKTGPVFTNRGLSGIDGNIATVFGIAKGQKTGVIAVLGDLTFLHDINSLSLASQMEHAIVFIVINNNGGGIFHHLPVANEQTVSKECFETCFGTPQSVSLKHAADLFDIDHYLPKTTDEFKLTFANATSTHKVSIIEVMTKREESAKIMQEMKTSLTAEKELV